jgi:hypothetical protein
MPGRKRQTLGGTCRSGSSKWMKTLSKRAVGAECARSSRFPANKGERGGRRLALARTRGGRECASSGEPHRVDVLRARRVLLVVAHPWTTGEQERGTCASGDRCSSHVPETRATTAAAAAPCTSQSPGWCCRTPTCLMAARCVARRKAKRWCTTVCGRPSSRKFGPRSQFRGGTAKTHATAFVRQAWHRVSLRGRPRVTHM